MKLKKISLIILMTLWPLILFGQYGQLSIVKFEVVDDTTNIDKSFGKAYSYSAEHYLGDGTYLSLIMTSGSTGGPFLRHDGTVELSGSWNAGSFKITMDSIYVSGYIDFDYALRYTLLGDSAGASITTGTDNTFVGHRAGVNVTSGGFNTAVGRNAMYTRTTGGLGVAVGYNAGYHMTNGGQFTAVGTSAGYHNTGVSNTFLGCEAGFYTTTGDGNTYVGASAGQGIDGATNGGFNTGVGHGALRDNSAGGSDVAVGYGASQENTSGNQNTNLGTYAGFYTQSGHQNVIVGYMAGYGSSGNSHTLNTFVGARAGYAITTGGSNVFLGYRAGRYQTTNSNLFIVDNQDRDSAAKEATRALMYGLFDADSSNQTLHINGRLSAYLYGSDGTVTDAELLYINTVSSNVQDQLDGMMGGDLLKDIVTTAPLTGAEDDVLPGADADLTLAITMLKDIVTTAPITGGENDVLPGGDADLTIAMAVADTDNDGYLSTTDWDTFNDKASTGSVALKLDIDLLEALASDGDYEGQTTTITVGENVAFGDVLVKKSDGEYYLTDADQSSTVPGELMALATATDGNTCLCLEPGGYVREDDWAWTLGDGRANTLYLDDDPSGGMVQHANQPSSSGDQICIVGRVITADIIFFHPERQIVEVE